MFAHIAASFRKTFPGRQTEWLLTSVLIGWAAMLIINPDMFRTTATYANFGEIMSQSMWAMACLYVGVARLAVLIINGAWRRSPHLRAGLAFLTCLFWYQITVGMLQSGTLSTGLAVYPAFFLFDAINVIRSMGDAAVTDHHYEKQAAADGTSE